MVKYLFYLTKCTIWLLLLFFVGCQSDEREVWNVSLQEALQSAGENRSELEKVLEHFSENPQDSVKWAAARFLISNMRGIHHYAGEWMEKYLEVLTGLDTITSDQYAETKADLFKDNPVLSSVAYTRQSDLHTLKADYLINHINLMFEGWQSSPWEHQISFETFCNYLLPYKVEEEIPEDWVTDMQSRYDPIIRQRDLSAVDLTSRINDELKDFRFNIMDDSVAMRFVCRI